MVVRCDDCKVVFETGKTSLIKVRNGESYEAPSIHTMDLCGPCLKRFASGLDSIMKTWPAKEVSR